MQTDRSQTYAITQDDAEMERLVNFARAADAHARDGLGRVGIGAGWKAIDVGCGPIGALLTLAEQCGPDGVVVGLDMDDLSLQRARGMLDHEGFKWVQLVHGNINELASDALCPPGPFDVAFCRNVLTHQKDPVHTLRHIAALVRPGGYIVAQSNMDNPRPVSEPRLPASERLHEWRMPILRTRGSTEVARRHRAYCETLGLKLVGQRGFFDVVTDGSIAKADRLSLASWSRTIVEAGIATEQEVYALSKELEAAETWEFQAVFSALTVEMIAQVPE